MRDGLSPEFLKARVIFAASLERFKLPEIKGDPIAYAAHREAHACIRSRMKALAPPGFYAAAASAERRVQGKKRLHRGPAAPSIASAEAEARSAKRALKRACREHLLDLIREHPERARALLRGRQSRPGPP